MIKNCRDIRSIAQDSISKQNLKGNKEILNSLIKIILQDNNE